MTASRYVTIEPESRDQSGCSSSRRWRKHCRTPNGNEQQNGRADYDNDQRRTRQRVSAGRWSTSRRTTSATEDGFLLSGMIHPIWRLPKRAESPSRWLAVRGVVQRRVSLSVAETTFTGSSQDMGVRCSGTVNARSSALRSGRRISRRSTDVRWN